VTDERLAALVAQVGSFHITDRTMRKAQDAAAKALANGALDPRQREEYLAAVRHYFAAFEREARGHLRDVDRRLEHTNQVHFNLAAERGVAVKRIEATQSVLSQLDAIGAERT
jgi:imidazolonepropionase-like amidohydrolase